MIAGVMRLGDRPVRALMTPMTDIDMLGVKDDLPDIRKKIMATTALAHSRPWRGSGGRHRHHRHQGRGGCAAGAARSWTSPSWCRRCRSSRNRCPRWRRWNCSAAPPSISPSCRMNMAARWGSSQRPICSTPSPEAWSPRARAAMAPSSARMAHGCCRATWRWTRWRNSSGFVLPPKRRYETVAGLVVDAFKHLPSLGQAVKVRQLALRGGRPRRPAGGQGPGEPGCRGPPPGQRHRPTLNQALRQRSRTNQIDRALLAIG